MKKDSIRTQAESATLETSPIVLNMSPQQVTLSNVIKTIDSMNKLNASKFLKSTKISSAPKIHQRQYFTSRMESANSEEFHVSRQTKMDHVDNVLQIPFI